MMTRACFLGFILLLNACEPSKVEISSLQLDIGSVLGGESRQGFLRAEQPRTFNFPEDHGLHAGFRNEWWYLTGNLESPEGRRFGYQVTFFNVALAPEAGNRKDTSAWRSDRIWMAHAALTDVDKQQHLAVERFSRESPGLAGAQSQPFKVWLENWSLEAVSKEINNAEVFPWRLSLEDEAFSLVLLLDPEKDLVLQGIDGLSQKSPESGNASYYYSYTRLQSRGTVTVDGEVFQLTGSSWLDREWSSSALADDQTGWDWFSLQFDDGQELMYYQLRDSSGMPHPNSQGNWTDRFSQQSLITTNDIQLEPLKSWESTSGIVYTTQWSLSYKGQTWIVRAVLDEQLMDLSLEYWEGAVDVILASTREQVGRGYLEMLRE